jgi:hypothetical protein
LLAAKSDRIECHGQNPRQHCHISMMRWILRWLPKPCQHDDVESEVADYAMSAL